MFKFFMGPLMDESGADGADAGGGLGADSTALATIDTGADVAVADDTDIDDTGTETQAVTVFDRGKPTKAFRDALAPLGRAAGPVYKDLGLASKMRRELGPNPMATIQRYRQMEREVCELGGQTDFTQALAQIKDDIHSVEQLDRLYSNGDPAMIEQMTATPEGRDSLGMIMPAAVQKWRQLAPNAYSAHVAQAVLGDMRQDMELTLPGINEALQVNFMFDLQDLARGVPRTISGLNDKNEQVTVPNPLVAVLTRIQAYVSHLQALAKATPEAPAAKKDAGKDELETQRQELAQQRRELNTQALLGQQQRVANAAFTKHYEAATKGRKVTTAQKEEIIADVTARTDMVLRGDQAHRAKLKAFADANDQQGHLRYMQGVYDRVYAKYVPQYANRVLGGSKPGPGTAAATVPGAKGAVDAGFGRITLAQLQAIGIDHGKDPGGHLFSQGKAYGRDGKKYQFRNFKG